MAVNHKSLLTETSKIIESAGESQANKFLRRAFDEKKIKPRDFDFGRLFAEAFGYHRWQAVKNDRSESAIRVMENAGGVTTASFQAISGQILYTQFLEGYQAEEFVFSKLIPDKQTPFRNERIAGVTGIGDAAEVVGEGEPYPYAQVGENYIDTGMTQKRGFIIALTKEAIFFDRTGQLLDQAKQCGFWAGYNKEKRAIDCVIDENGGSTAGILGHRYRWLGNEIATYGDNSGTHSWDNLVAANALVDYTDVENVLLNAKALSDPFTGVPINFSFKHLVVTPQLMITAHNILSPLKVRLANPGYATSSNPVVTDVENPLRWWQAEDVQVVSSQLLANQLGTDTSWFMGDIGKAFVYRVNFPMEVIQAPANSHDEFTRDIVQQYKVTEMGNYFTMEPRYMQKSTVA